MNKFYSRISLIVIAIVLSVSIIFAQELESEQLYKKVLPSIMTLKICEINGDSMIGTAFMTIKDGIAATAWHVIEDASSVTAKFSSGEEFDVSGVIDIDQERDIALILVKGFGRPLLKLSDKNPKVGMKVYVIGTPKGLEFSMSDGIVSQIRMIDTAKLYQFTCPASPGNSGSPLLNSKGEVIGIVSKQISEGQNLNFATPAAYILGLATSHPATPFIISSSSPKKLEYKFQKGKTYRYSNISNSNVTQEMMGKEMKITNASDMTFRILVDNVANDGNLALIVSVDSAKNTTKSSMMDTTMILSNLIGKRTKITISKIGAVLSREVIDTIKNEGMMGSGSQRGMAQITRLPEKEVKIGEKWNSTTIDTVESMGGKIFHTSNFEYTLSGKEKKQNHDCLKIDYTGTTSDTGKMMMNGMELFVEGDGKVKGIIYFDPKLGMTIVDESTTDNEQTMAITGQQNMTIPMSVTSKSIKTLLEK